MKKFVFISDTHRTLNLHKVGSGDVLVHSGDEDIRDEKDLRNLGDWFLEQDFELKLFVPGNHDLLVEQMPDFCLSILSDYGVNMLLGSSINYNELKIYGHPYVPIFGYWAFMPEHEELRWHVNNIPNDVDILISHGPPKYILDNSGKGNCGCEFLLQKVEQIRPIVNAFGHIHESYGSKNFHDTLFINAAISPGLVGRTDKYPMAVEIEDKKVKDFYKIGE